MSLNNAFLGGCWSYFSFLFFSKRSWKYQLMSLTYEGKEVETEDKENLNWHSLDFNSWLKNILPNKLEAVDSLTIIEGKPCESLNKCTNSNTSDYFYIEIFKFNISEYSNSQNDISVCRAQTYVL